MPFGREPLREPFRKLRESLKHIEKNPPPEEVHKLRTQARRIESIASALNPNGGKKARRLVRPVKKLRKAAGGVRDMDVLTTNALLLRDQSNGTSLKRLLDYLASTRAKNALALLKTVKRESKPARRSLRKYKHLVKAEPSHANGAVRPADSGATAFNPFRTAAIELTTELRSFPTISPANIHSYRLKVKELRYVLQALPDSDPALQDALSAVKDQIGEWHDWQQLALVAREALPDASDAPLLAKVKKIAQKKLRQAKLVANAMRDHWLDPEASRN